MSRSSLYRQTAVALSFIAFTIGEAQAEVRGQNTAWCYGTALRKSCMRSSADEKVCAYPIEKGTQTEFMAYEYDDFVKSLVVYRLGSYKAADFRLDEDCKFKNYLDFNPAPLLRGFEKSCSTNRAFDEFQKTVSKQTPDLKIVAAQPKLPKEISVRSTELKNSVESPNSDYSTIAVNMPGIYRGLDVAGIEVTVGHGNGINSVSIIFPETIAKIRSKFGSNWSTTPKTNKLDEFGSVTYVLKPHKGFTAAICDWSN